MMNIDFRYVAEALPVGEHRHIAVQLPIDIDAVNDLSSVSLEAAVKIVEFDA